MAAAILQDFCKRRNQFEYLFYIKKFLQVDGGDHVSFSTASVKFKNIKPYAVDYRDLFKNGILCLEKYEKDGVDGLPETEKECLKCLIKFLDSKEKHLQCLRPFMDLDTGNDSVVLNKMKETKYTLLLAEHLFSHLVPGSNYFIDRNHFPKDMHTCTCPGTCKKDLGTHFSKPTGIGNEMVWHGYADIWLEKISIPFNVVVDDPNLTTEMTKQDEAEESIEVKQQHHKLFSNDTVSKTVAQTVVNSFIQSKNGIPGFIPTICTTFDHLLIYLYDCQNDVFLISAPNSPLCLFEDETFIDDHIICLWMILNYQVFAVRSYCGFLDFCTDNKLFSGFHVLVGDSLRIYKEKLIKNSGSFKEVKEKETVYMPFQRAPFP